jgi:DNA polymerase-3 subunit gamma/tau
MSLAIYRKYRPGQFADVIGQDHVTGPLTRALDSDRLHHAYLFTGPRGCGKTSSARIMARSMNCEQGPTSTPCGRCQSCIDLAPNGPGSIDVIEIDAATYRGIDDAKELRERAVYAPVAARHKVYIIDEAHQLTKEAFNVLLKLVEEPPPHLRFIFATTEPDRIIPTLRSRTHHYPFRLVSAAVLQSHLADICNREGVAAEPSALALVARAGAGSVRDAQSVLGQVIAGSGPEGVTYAETVAQLGFTDDVVLGQVLAAIAAGDGAAVMTLVNEVVSSGHEPRRFAIDLLERLRDLIVVKQVPDAVRSGLFELPQEQASDLVEQAALFTAAQLVRVADLVSAGLSELRGATAPRLQLELLAARLVTTDVSLDISDRVTALERGRVAARAAADAPAQRTAVVAPAPTVAAPTAPAAIPNEPATAQPKRSSTPASKRSGAPAPKKPSQVIASAATASEPPQPTMLTGDVTFEQVRSNWPAVVKAMSDNSKVAGALLRDSVPLSLTEGILVVAFPNSGVLSNAQSGGHVERLTGVVQQIFGAAVRIDAVLDPGATQVAVTRRVDTTDSGDASPDDEVMTTKSALDLVTETLGAKVVAENPRAT